MSRRRRRVDFRVLDVADLASEELFAATGSIEPVRYASNAGTYSFSLREASFP